VTRGAALAVRGLTKDFPGGVQALRDVDLDAAAGEVVALIGPSGSGKSTLFRILAGLDRPTAGEVLLDGAVVARPLGRTAWMPQRDGLLAWRRTLDNVTLGLEQAGVRKADARARALPLLERFGLAEFADAWPWQLSGGMRQRAAFLRTVLTDRPAMLLDEPFGALDGITRAEVQAWLLEVWEEVGSTVLLITHDVAEAVRIADRVYVLSARPGRIAGEVMIALPRPRPHDIAETPKFAAYETTLRRALREVA
jgi:ABC-type nitrate/sulfonate/bicarbonate transport system ATPase subunit